jgi:hypothetical protein
MMEGEEQASEQRDYRGKLRRTYQTVNEEPSMTVQSDADGADINKILAKYAATGIIDGLREVEIKYHDISEFTDFADAQRQLKVVEGEFMKLPSKVRGIFDHDVANWLDTAMDQEKRDALVEAGYIEAPSAPAEVAVEGAPGGAGGEATEVAGTE